MNQAEEDALITQYCDSIHPAWHKDIRLAIRAAVAHERERCADAVFDLSDGEYADIAAVIRRGDD